jgi:hypothetical protein
VPTQEKLNNSSERLAHKNKTSVKDYTKIKKLLQPEQP